jgi:hypothetical protein
MLNLVVSQKGSNEIKYFIKNCEVNGNNLIGDNCKVKLKLTLFDIKWTEDVIEPIFDENNNQTGWSKLLNEISDAKTYNSDVVSTREDVNTSVVKKIRERYSLDDELKILRLKLIGDNKEFDEYQTYVSSIVVDADKFKDENFLKEIV